jgi:TPR repeat protein
LLQEAVWVSHEGGAREDVEGILLRCTREGDKNQAALAAAGLAALRDESGPESMVLLRWAADGGVAEAAERLSRYLLRGLFAERNPGEALRYAEMAIANGVSSACFGAYLACREMGDLDRACEFLGRAVAADDPVALLTAASQLLDLGDGSSGWYLMRRAADLGVHVARLELIVNDLKTERRSAALAWIEEAIRSGTAQMEFLVTALIRIGEFDLAQRCRRTCVGILREEMKKDDMLAALRLMYVFDRAGCDASDRCDLSAALQLLARRGDSGALRMLNVVRGRIAMGSGGSGS